MDSHEVLHIDPPFHPILVKPKSSKGKKKIKVGGVRGSWDADGADDKEDDDDMDYDSPPYQSQHPLSGDNMEEDLATFPRAIGGTTTRPHILPPLPVILRCSIGS